MSEIIATGFIIPIRMIAGIVIVITSFCLGIIIGAAIRILKERGIL